MRRGWIQALLSGPQGLVYLEPSMARDDARRSSDALFKIQSFDSAQWLIGNFTPTRNQKTPPPFSLLEPPPRQNAHTIRHHHHHHHHLFHPHSQSISTSLLPLCSRAPQLSPWMSSENARLLVLF